MPTRAILLDALGTLVALEPPVPALSGLLRDRHGIEVGADAVTRAMRAEMGHYRERCVRASDAASLAALRHECAAIVAHELALELTADELVQTLLDSIRFRPYLEVRPTLARWREAGVRLVVASNWDVSLHDVLAATGLRELLDGVITSAEVGVAKPSPALFAAALDGAGADARDAIHVGDSLVNDVEGALRAGLRAAWIVRDGSTARPSSAPAGVPVIATLDALELAL